MALSYSTLLLLGQILATSLVATSNENQVPLKPSHVPDPMQYIDQRIQELEQRLDDQLAGVDQRAIQYVQWQATLFSILMAIVLFIAGVAYAVGMFFGYKLLKANLAPLADRYDEALRLFSQRASATIKASYDTAMIFAQVCVTYADASKRVPLASETRVALMRVEVAAALLRVAVGESADVKTGADILSYMSTLSEAGPTLREALERDDISQDSREALKQALSKLQERRDPGGGT